MNYSKLLRTSSEVFNAYWTLPRLTVELTGDEECVAAFRRWTRRHPKMPLLRQKELGVALLEVPASFNAYLASRRTARHRRSRALRLGYTFRPLDVTESIDDIMAINSSMDVRQGRAIATRYLCREDVLAFHHANGANYGVFDTNGRLVAYSCIPIWGEAAIVSRVLGHSEHLSNGIMYLMMTEIVAELINSMSRYPNLKWFQYDTWYGASSGLRFFKEHLGFHPYRVKWTLASVHRTASGNHLP
jgi:hypothetical protein